MELNRISVFYGAIQFIGSPASAQVSKISLLYRSLNIFDFRAGIQKMGWLIQAAIIKEDGDERTDRAYIF